jgi:hypothetical protein
VHVQVTPADTLQIPNDWGLICSQVPSCSSLNPIGFLVLFGLQNRTFGPYFPGCLWIPLFAGGCEND